MIIRWLICITVQSSSADVARRDDEEEEEQEKRAKKKKVGHSEREAEGRVFSSLLIHKKYSREKEQKEKKKSRSNDCFHQYLVVDFHA